MANIQSKRCIYLPTFEERKLLTFFTLSSPHRVGWQGFMQLPKEQWSFGATEGSALPNADIVF
eukprot:1154466-Pelagomonas_calceolata.AAC.2